MTTYLLTNYAWFAFGFLLFGWIVLLAAPLIGHKWRPGWLIFMTVVCGLCLAGLIYNELWGPAAAHSRQCESLRERYEAAETIVDLERARDRLRASRCNLVAS